ncbi:hypothetical protein [Natronorubrum halophilum]|uniref:hypothetical protein n=1 Tax=Natronorubrum halophilum TaxID=1702106 RepID=UPI000EF64312|nr:hypothetical protein [Natronorubrum halophilum]
MILRCIRDRRAEEIAIVFCELHVKTIPQWPTVRGDRRSTEVSEAVDATVTTTVRFADGDSGYR